MQELTASTTSEDSSGSISSDRTPVDAQPVYRTLSQCQWLETRPISHLPHQNGRIFFQFMMAYHLTQVHKNKKETLLLTTVLYMNCCRLSLTQLLTMAFFEGHYRPAALVLETVNNCDLIDRAPVIRLAIQQLKTLYSHVDIASIETIAIWLFQKHGGWLQKDGRDLQLIEIRLQTSLPPPSIESEPAVIAHDESICPPREGVCVYTPRCTGNLAFEKD